ncbi:hypothetical protein GWI33_014043 [Rhynchophorus ferrugineus]|uniref:Uncharacterized protein n=1 Tax=Rhynchophorus ferrugineus TaxID=354439 RepID=A0A834I5A5_RHYFE|nr:hypothetical protein GWI33_014043 [Rhynchophorus ferrugineus]
MKNRRKVFDIGTAAEKFRWETARFVAALNYDNGVGGIRCSCVILTAWIQDYGEFIRAIEPPEKKNQ